jgi:ABC-type Na+ efflux pump permease subunit
LQNLLIGLSLIVVSIGAVIVCRPKNGKTVWFVGIPFLAPLVSITIVAGLALGIFLIATHYTAIDNATIGGAVRKL